MHSILKVFIFLNIKIITIDVDESQLAYTQLKENHERKLKYFLSHPKSSVMWVLCPFTHRTTEGQ